MTVYSASIVDSTGANPALGDDATITRAVTGLSTSPDQTISKAWITVKANLTDADGSAALQIDTADAAGEITDDGTGATTGEVEFTISGTHYDSLTAGTLYWYDIQLLLSDGVISTLERGRVVWESEVTGATS